ncbi:MAG: OsmC family protein [Acidobacteria bacterium]|nr:OsmC family protein [Acidobacteriota bacterium]
MGEQSIITTLELQEGYRFLAHFDQNGTAPLLTAPLLMDEPLPLGEGKGPSAARVLSAALGNCLSASALFCLRKARIPVNGMRTTVETRLARSPQGRQRIGGVTVRIALDVPPEDRGRVGRCLELFEDFCVVTQSVRQGISVDVDVEISEAR